MNKLLGILIGIVLLSVGVMVAQADDFQWIINCKEMVNGQTHVWVGYSSAEALPNSYLSYLGNGPGIEMDSFEAGEHDRAVDVITDFGDVTLILDPQEISITITADTDASDCDAPQTNMATITLAAPTGNSFAWQKRDPYGHWGDVGGVVTPAQDENGQRFTRLVLGPDNSDHNPSDYRIVAVS